MSNSKLTVPDKIKVGYNKREDTYSGKLAYVIYQDSKGVWRKETSWDGWINKKEGIDNFDNVPTEGFVLNKKVGGKNWSWNPRNEYIRVYDPRGFEIEITLPNLLFILNECDCTKGKGLTGSFVYAWDKDKLVLLPVDTNEYKESKNYTDYKSKAKSLKSNQLMVGKTYLNSNKEKIVYLGKLPYIVEVDHKNPDFSKLKNDNGLRDAFLSLESSRCYSSEYIKVKGNYHKISLAKSISAVELVEDAEDFDVIPYINAYNKQNRNCKILSLNINSDSNRYRQHFIHHDAINDIYYELARYNIYIDRKEVYYYNVKKLKLLDGVLHKYSYKEVVYSQSDVEYINNYNKDKNKNFLIQRYYNNMVFGPEWDQIISSMVPGFIIPYKGKENG